MGDWNEWNDLQGFVEEYDTGVNARDGKEKLREILNEPNKYVYKKKVNNVMKKITMYSSGGFGHNIVNPIDNTMYNMKVGSKDELNFFSVRFTSKRFIGKEKDIITLYYDTPYAYERHHHIELPINQIKKWEETHKMAEKSPDTQEYMEIK